VLAVALALFASSVYIFVVRTLQSDINQTLTTYAQQVNQAAAPHVEGTRLNVKAVNIPKVPRKNPVAPVGIMSVYGETQVVKTKKGHSTLDYGPLRYALRSGHRTCVTLASSVGTTTHKVPVRVCADLIYHNRKTVGAFEVVQSLAPIDEALDRLRLALLLGIPFALALAGAGGWILAGRALEPVDRITQMARSITATDLSRRINLNRQDELGRLAGTFDEMIDRLERAFQEHRQLAADVSHELRSPLTILEAQTSLALRRSRSVDEYQQVLSSMQEEVERMSSMLNQLLTLTRADAGEEPMQLEPLSVASIARPVVDNMQPLADEKGVSLTLEADATVWVQGDGPRLRQLLINLLDNAIRHTPRDGRIEVKVSREAGEAVMRVVDTGEGISPQDLPHVFQRFYRGDRARQRGTGNSGLGLAIVKWIVDAHGGVIEVRSVPGKGAVFTVRLGLVEAPVRLTRAV
jgi:heavy metal sensor kinase